MRSVNVITPRNIVLYAKCPKRCRYSWDTIPSKHDYFARAIKDIIRQAYLKFTRRNEPVSWRSIKDWIDHKIQIYAEENPTSNILTDYTQRKGFIAKLSDWYSTYYLGSVCGPGLPNVPITLHLGNNFYYRDSLPILLTDDLRIVDFLTVDEKRDIELYNGPRLYNDLLMHTRVWGFIQSTDIIPTAYIRYVIGSKITAPRVTLTKETLKKTDNVIRHIINGMKEQVYYPAISTQCKTCPHQKECSY